MLPDSVSNVIVNLTLTVVVLKCLGSPCNGMLFYWNSVVTVHMAQLDIFWEILEIKFVDKCHIIIVIVNGRTLFKTTQLINTEFYRISVLNYWPTSLWIFDSKSLTRYDMYRLQNVALSCNHFCHGYASIVLLIVDPLSWLYCLQYSVSFYSNF